MTEPDRVIRNLVDTVFSGSPFSKYLGIELLECAPGRCLARLKLCPELLQQTGYAHAGVVGTLGDQCAGAAAMSLAPEDRTVVTVEYKINLLRPGVGDWLLCRSSVLKPGRTLSIVESEVLAEREGAAPVLVAKLMVTLAIIPRA